MIKCFMCYSVYKWESILEKHTDAHSFGLKSGNSTAVSNSSLAISWLEATFPELAHQEAEGLDLSTLRAHPYALFDASLSLQVSLLSCLCVCGSCLCSIDAPKYVNYLFQKRHGIDVRDIYLSNGCPSSARLGFFM